MIALENRIGLAHPEALVIAGSMGERWLGADQEWYRQLWHRKAGCGPTAAAVQMAYLSRTRPALAPLCTLKTMEQEPFAAYMDAVWDHVTPGAQGLNTVAKYSLGVRSFAAARGLALAPLELVVAKKVTTRPAFSDCAAFIRNGLESDCPVAFLNLHNGRLENLDSWHWVLITALSRNVDAVTCTVADGGQSVEIDLRLWYDTTREGGGFVYLPGEERT